MKFCEGSVPVDTFVAVAFDDRWYLGQVAEIMPQEEAKMNYMKRVGQSYFQWPSPPDLKETKAIYLLEDGISIAPKYSRLRILF